MSSNSLNVLSPLDGRYSDKVAPLTSFFSEKALMRCRLIAMIEHLILLGDMDDIPLKAFAKSEKEDLRAIAINFSDEWAEVIKAIEMTGHGDYMATKHDVKACEIFLREQLTRVGLSHTVEWLRFGRTSEDDNNVAYALMLMGAVHQVMLPTLDRLVDELRRFATDYAAVSLLALTHGQPATPTTLGKEFAVFRKRLERQVNKLREFGLLIKINGASGCYAAEQFVYPDVDWLKMSLNYCRCVNKYAHGRLELNLLTTQIEPHDTYAELFNIFHMINTILLDLSTDVWLYVSRNVLAQRPVEGEVGSSAMPHKVNPIDWENAEGNLGIANALFGFFADKLPRSRMQRDLSDSTVERNFGVAFGHSLIAYQSILRGLGKVYPNLAAIECELDVHPEVLAEVLQSALRSVGFPNAYDVLKSISRGKEITLGDLRAFIRQYEADFGPVLTNRLLALIPATFTGLAEQLARL